LIPSFIWRINNRLDEESTSIKEKRKKKKYKKPNKASQTHKTELSSN
jgi:hypothetical protein